MKGIKAKLLLLATAVLGTPILAHAGTPPTDGFCAHASDKAIATINILLALAGLPPIC